jgi:serine/threonine protein kinase
MTARKKIEGVTVARRLPSQPPVLPGFSHVHILGSGGFADVFLYEQNMPRRQVAVKVMLSEVVNEQVRQMFQAEANLMAQLSAHPSILTVYQAGVSGDGRPYLVMELCSSSLSERYRRERIPVAEVLRVAVKIGSAIETAHRAGVLHRDIKPSNILLTAYGHPVLSDFGIASTLNESEGQESVGLSIPWSAPEVLMDETPGTIQSEVWSFAATVYSLLAGRSPFEIAGQSNKSSDLIGRINRAKVQPIGRTDVPHSLEEILHKAMSRKVDARPRTVLELVRELQTVETGLGLPQTVVEVTMDDWAFATVSNDEDKTRIRPVHSAPPLGKNRRRRSIVAEPFAPAVTMVKSGAGSLSSGIRPANAGGGTRTLGWILVAAAVLVIALGAFGVSVMIKAGDSDIPRVADISATQSSTAITFSWADPGIDKNSDSYQITTSDGQSSIQQPSAYIIDAKAGERACITVAVNRAGKTGPASSQKCVVFSG